MDMKYFPSQEEIYLFQTGEAQEAYRIFGCHFVPEIGSYRFCLWAPNARRVSVVGDFNEWDLSADLMQEYHGIWVAFISGCAQADSYKFAILGQDGHLIYKADPFAVHAEVRPNTASKVWNITPYSWGDSEFLEKRWHTDHSKKPISIYELDLGSWRKKEGYTFVSAREIADELADYVSEMGFTHVEFMPLTEYPLDGSWGYQVTGYFALTSRYGTPEDYMYLVDKLHQKGIGVIMDCVLAHFPKDEHGLRRFDGSALFEHENPLQGEHPQWGTMIFNYGKPEVQSFLISSIVHLFERFHIDGIRLDAVSSMLYLNYGKEKYIPNIYGGDYNLEAIDFLRKLNSTILTRFAGTVTIAEESTAFPLITMPPANDGLGFSYKWNMGFMNDTLKYFTMNPLYRSGNHNLINFSMFYAFSENFILSYSHDEVVHGKHSMIDKMYGNYEEKFANLKVLYANMFAHPGKKLMFMGCEFAQFIEWKETEQLDWFLLDYPIHKAIQLYVKTLNELYSCSPALYEIDRSWAGFRWLAVDDNQNSIMAYLRTDEQGSCIAAVFNFTPVLRKNYEIGAPCMGKLSLILNSDDEKFGGWGNAIKKTIFTEQRQGQAGNPCTAKVDIPPLTALFYKFE